MAKKTNSPRITFKRQYQNIEAYTIYVNGEKVKHTDGGESWVNFGWSSDKQPFDCTCFLYVNNDLLMFQLPATPQTIHDTLNALRPIIQQAIINGELQAAGVLNESK